MLNSSTYFQVRWKRRPLLTELREEIQRYFWRKSRFCIYTTEDQGQELKKKVFTVPLLINYYSHGNCNHFEAGAGLVLGNEKKSYSSGYEYNHAINEATGFIGYRYQKREKGFLCRPGLTLLYTFRNSDFWLS